MHNTGFLIPFFLKPKHCLKELIQPCVFNYNFNLLDIMVLVAEMRAEIGGISFLEI